MAHLSDALDYYALILEAQKKGCRQVILTSDIMIKIAEAFLTTESATITDIAFFVEDDNLQKEIAKLIELMRQNSAYWGALKDKLKFLSEDDSIDIKKISLQGKEYPDTAEIFRKRLFHRANHGDSLWLHERYFVGNKQKHKYGFSINRIALTPEFIRSVDSYYFWQCRYYGESKSDFASARG